MEIDPYKSSANRPTSTPKPPVAMSIEDMVREIITKPSGANRKKRGPDQDKQCTQRYPAEEVVQAKALLEAGCLEEAEEFARGCEDETIQSEIWAEIAKSHLQSLDFAEAEEVAEKMILDETIKRNTLREIQSSRKGVKLNKTPLETLSNYHF